MAIATPDSTSSCSLIKFSETFLKLSDLVLAYSFVLRFRIYIWAFTQQHEVLFKIYTKLKHSYIFLFFLYFHLEKGPRPTLYIYLPPKCPIFVWRLADDRFGCLHFQFSFHHFVGRLFIFCFCHNFKVNMANVVGEFTIIRKPTNRMKKRRKEQTLYSKFDQKSNKFHAQKEEECGYSSCWVTKNFIFVCRIPENTSPP